MEAANTPRIALLSLDSTLDSAASNRRRIGGSTVLERQVDIALALGCTRIWLFASQQDELAIRAQRMAESGGAQFRLVQRGRQLLGSLRQQDELLVLAEGLLPFNREALDLLRTGPVILRLPAEKGVQAGFERMDQDHCWAGAMVLPGRVIERLDELAEDMEPVSALLRAGRVCQVAERPLPLALLAEEQWSLRANSLPGQLADPGGTVATHWFKRKFGDPLVQWLAERPRSRLACASGSAFAVGAAALLIQLSYSAAALLSIALGAFLVRLWISARKLADARFFSKAHHNRSLSLLPLLPDAVGMSALWSGVHTVFGLESTSYFVVVTCATWLLAGLGKGQSAQFFERREALWLCCGLTGIMGYWFAGLALATVAALIGILLNLRNRPAITQA